MRPTARGINPLDSVKGWPFLFHFQSSFQSRVCVNDSGKKKDSGLFPFPNYGALTKNNLFFAWRPSAYFFPISIVPHSFLFQESDWNPSGKHRFTLSIPCSSSVQKQQPCITIHSASPSLLKRLSSYTISKKSILHTKKHDLWSEDKLFMVLEPALES